MNYTEQQIFDLQEQERLEQAYRDSEIIQDHIERIYENLLKNRRSYLRVKTNSKVVVNSVLYFFKNKGFCIELVDLQAFKSDIKQDHYMFTCK